MNRRVLAAAEGALALVTVSVALGYGRLFTDTSFVPRVLLVAVTAHLLGAIWHRRGWSPWTTMAIQLVAGALVLSWVYLGDTLAFGLPTGRTWDAARDQLAQAFEPFGELVAPVPLTPGFALAMGLSLWVVATFAGVAAFGGRAPVQAVIPHLALVVATSLLARGRGAVAAAAWFVAATLFHLAAHRAWRESARRWVGDEGARGGLRLAALGAAGAVVVGLAAAWLGPALPGATSPAAIDVRALGRGSGPLEVGNPLVGVANLLGPQSDQIVFRATSEDPHYWRLTSLERFDPSDQQWKTRRSYREVESGATLPSDRPEEVPTEAVEARFELSALGGIWLPAVMEPTAVEADLDIRYDEESASLIAGREADVDAAAYTVRADVPLLDDGAIDSLSRTSATVGATYLDDTGVSAVAARTAREVTAGARSRYEQARDLQDFLRTFTYRTDVDYSAEPDPTAAFLEDREGFCQQFASTFAQMARSLGIPARVAVGFTAGEPDPEAGPAPDGATAVTYVVRGRHAHAWPEVMIPGIGWTPFEPTPTRGNPDTVAYTGVPEAQAPPSPDDLPAAPTTVPDRRPPDSVVPPDGDVATGDLTEDDTGAAGADGGPDAARLLAIVLGLALAGLLGRAGWVALSRRRRLGPRDTPDARVRAAWVESCDWLEMVALRRGDAETPVEFAERADRRVGPTDLGDLARLETERVYSGAVLGDDAAAQAEAARDRVRVAVEDRVDPRRRRLARLGWLRRN